MSLIYSVILAISIKIAPVVRISVEMLDPSDKQFVHYRLLRVLSVLIYFMVVNWGDVTYSTSTFEH